VTRRRPSAVVGLPRRTRPARAPSAPRAR
jgi:hypothetical protein